MPKPTSPGSPTKQPVRTTPTGGTSKGPGSSGPINNAGKAPQGLYGVNGSPDTSKPTGLEKGPDKRTAGKGRKATGRFPNEVNDRKDRGSWGSMK